LAAGAPASPDDAAGLLKPRTAPPRAQAKFRGPAATKQPDGQITSDLQKLKVKPRIEKYSGFQKQKTDL
jgi:hypothetical protein